jgi:hypothetical protein
VKTADSALVFGKTDARAIVLGRKDYASGVIGRGVGRISGTVKEDGTPDFPVWRRVRLIRESDGLVVRQQWSHPVTGAYQFDFVDELQRYTVLSYDHNHNFRAVDADNLTPDLIPVVNPTEAPLQVVRDAIHTNFKVVSQSYQNTMATAGPLPSGYTTPTGRVIALCAVVRTSGFNAAAQPTNRWVLAGSVSATVGANTLTLDLWYQPDAPTGGESIGFFQALATPMNGQIFYLQSTSGGPPKLASFTPVSASNTTVSTLALPTPAVPRDGSIAIGFAGVYSAAATPAVTGITNDAGWPLVTPAAADQTRVGVFAQQLDTGVVPAANALFSGLSGAANALVGGVAVFTAF